MRKRGHSIQVALIAISSITVGTILASCNGTGKSASTSKTTDTVAVQATKNKPADDTNTYMLPSPLEIGTIFKNAGLSYLSGLTNPVNDLSKYNSKYTQALNMGIYGADLSYCILNKQTQDALTYLKTLKSLADKLGFGTVFEVNNMAKRFEKNLNSEDSLTDITSDLQMETDTYLGENGQKYIGAISFAGAWMESMYIGSKVYAVKSNDRINARISEQMTILQNLIKALTTYTGQESRITEIVSSLKEIEASYRAFEEVKTSPESEQNPKLTDAHISQLGKQIQELRQKFIS